MKWYHFLNRFRENTAQNLIPIPAKTPNELWTEEIFLNLTKGIYEKPTATSIFSYDQYQGEHVCSH